MKPSRTFPITVAARILGVSKRTVRHWIATGRLPGWHDGYSGTWQVPIEALEELLQQRRTTVLASLQLLEQELDDEGLEP